MIFQFLTLLCSTAIVVAISGLNAATAVTPIPLRFVATQNYALSSSEKAYFKAAIGCDSLKTSTLSVCAELPFNWKWNSTLGYVYMNIFNTNDTSNISKALGSTGNPYSDKSAVQCTNITGWAGGDMYIRVDANHFDHVVFTLSVKVLSSTPSERRNTERLVLPNRLRATEDSPVTAGTFTLLTPIIVVEDLVTLEYNQGITFEIDLCIQSRSSKQTMTTTVLAKTGVYTHFICTTDQCGPDTLNQLGWQRAPLPAGVAHGTIYRLPKVFVAVYNLDGEYDAKTQKVIGQFRFGAVLS